MAAGGDSLGGRIGFQVRLVFDVALCLSGFLLIAIFFLFFSVFRWLDGLVAVVSL